VKRGLSSEEAPPEPFRALGPEILLEPVGALTLPAQLLE
jgi:hypothetical protein